MTGRLFSFYGDDFTGSTDAFEALAGNGVESVLFLQPPGDAELARFPGCRAIGVAGDSRSRSPEWMSSHLPGIFRNLKEYGAPICQYKVCSTFDSAPHVGSIGRALEIGRTVFEAPWAPIVVALPHFGRYVVFGNLFAAGGGAVHRIDRHPTMSRHPVTPMDESDLRRHLARQTDTKLALLDLAGFSGDRLDELIAQQPGAVLFDGIDARHQAETGRMLWERRPAFGIGSSGLTYALIAHWKTVGLAPAGFTPPSAGVADRLIVVSGSCSPVTEAQIQRAIASGFSGVAVHDFQAAFDTSRAELAAGRSVVLYTALGAQALTPVEGGESLGRRLGEMLRDLLLSTGVRRAVVAGGDTASYAVRELGIDALTYLAPTAPGAPLCRTHGGINGIELALKGGQVGGEDYFERVRRGHS